MNRLPSRTRRAAALAAAAILVSLTIVPTASGQPDPSAPQIGTAVRADPLPAADRLRAADPLPSADPVNGSDPVQNVVPRPTTVVAGAGPAGTITADSVIRVDPADEGAQAVGRQFAAEIAPATGFRMPIADRNAASPAAATIWLTVDAESGIPEEGYRLTSNGTYISITAATAAGLYRGATTLRQLLPVQIGSSTPVARRWTVPSIEITDAPRYSFRGAMLDVGRRFYPVADVKRFIDQAALYKYNVLHLHLTDDQGWRIAVDAFPELTRTGASTQSGWAPGTGGPWFYTAAEYQDLLSYAQARYIEVVPEIDGPGHSLAAQASVPGLTCNGEPAAPYFGFDVGLPPVCLQPQARATVGAFITEVLQDVAARTPGRFVHIGGDEVPSTTDEQFDWYVRTASAAVGAADRRVMGWVQIGKGTLPAGAVLQWWGDESDQRTIGTAAESEKIRDLRAGLAQGAEVVASPADRSYLDMKYDATVPYGLQWAGLVDLKRSYDWDPVSATSRPDGTKPVISEQDVLGVEAALWADRAYAGSTSLPTSLSQYPPPAQYADFTSFPRLPAIAEVGWTQPANRDFADFQRRLLAHAARWTAMGIGFYRAPDVPWPITATAVVASAGQQRFGTDRPVVLTATVTAPAPAPAGTVLDGEVVFRDGSRTIGAAPLDDAGRASFEVPSATSVGNHRLTGTFVPADPSPQLESTSEPVDVKVDMALSTTSVTATVGTAKGKRHLRITATVTLNTPTSPTGLVNLNLNGTKVAAIPTVTSGPGRGTATVDLPVTAGSATLIATFAPTEPGNLQRSTGRTTVRIG